MKFVPNRWCAALPHGLRPGLKTDGVQRTTDGFQQCGLNAALGHFPVAFQKQITVWDGGVLPKSSCVSYLNGS